MSTVNLYDVLNISQDSSIREIKNAYNILVKEFHPDKPGGNIEMFELITHAYNVLINPASKIEYDEIYNNLSEQIEKTHHDLKLKSKNYYELQDIEKKKKNKDEKSNEFKKIFESMDRKHKYNRDKELDDKIPEKNTVKRLRDLQLAREQDDIENTHENIFENGRFDPNIFNAAFSEMNKDHTELIPHQGNPEAWNPLVVLDTNFSTIDNYENLYTEDDNICNSIYGSVKLDSSKKKILTKEEINKLSSTSYSSHSHKDDDYDKKLEEKIRQIELEAKVLGSKTFCDFDTNPDCGGYGIIPKNLNTITWNDDENIQARYKKLLEMRNQV